MAHRTHKNGPKKGWTFSHTPRFIDAPVTRPMPTEDARDEAQPVFTSDPYTRVMSPVKKVLERPKKVVRRRSNQSEEQDGVSRMEDDLDRSSLFATSHDLRALQTEQDETDGAVPDASEEVDTTDISEAYGRACRTMKVVPSSCYVRHCGRKILDMKYQGLGPNGTKAVACSLLSNPHVSVVDLTGNNMGTEGAHCLAELLQDSNTILEMSVAENQLGREGVMSILHVLITYNNVLTGINLAGNDIDDTCAPMLAHLLKATLVLTSLNLSHNKIGEKGALLLGPALAYNNTLTELDLSWNSIRRNGATAVAMGVKDNSSLKKLNLAWNGFCMEGARALELMLKDNDVLEELDLSKNRIDEESVKYVARGLARNSNLQILKLVRNPMQEAGCTALCAALLKKETCSLRMLDLEEILINKTGEELRAKLRDKFPTLRVRTGSEALSQRAKARLHPMIKIINYIEKHKMKLVDFFKHLDKDGGMSVDREEFIEGLEEVGINLLPEEIELLLDELDKDGDGEISYSEMVIGHQEFTQRSNQMIRLGQDTTSKSDQDETPNPDPTDEQDDG